MRQGGDRNRSEDQQEKQGGVRNHPMMPSDAVAPRATALRRCEA